MTGQQLDLPVDLAEVKLTERQQYALEQLERMDGLDASELGARMHERRGKHDAGDRCQWCEDEGRSVAKELRRKGLVIRRRSGLWESLRTRPATAPSSQEPASGDVDWGGFGE